MADMADGCQTCGRGVALNENCLFCPFCGSKFDGVEVENLIKYYFSRGFSYNSIVSFLSSQHGIVMCERTLRSRLQDYGLRRRLPHYDIEHVRQRIRQELDGPGCMGGYRSIWHTLRMEGFQVQRNVVEAVVRELDPEGCELRKAKRLRRRKYQSAGPNHCWHMDGYDKLKPYGFPIHACIDGWSRKIMWLKVSRSNNQAAIPGVYFLDCVKEFGGCPVKVRTDCGTENGIVAAIQCTFRESENAHVYGSSPANQRIEAWWSFFRRNRSTWWINYFKDLIDREKFHPGNDLESEALWYCFNTVLQKDMDIVKEHWNTHRIRDSFHNTIPGRPDELYHLPERHGGEADLKMGIDEQMIQYVTENLLQFEDEQNDYREYFDFILANSDLHLPSNWSEAENLYLELISIAL